MSKNQKLTKADKKLIRELFWYSFPLENAYNYERQQALGFAIGMWPAIRRFYPDKKDQAEALVRHMAIFNTSPQIVTVITGVTAVLEKEASLNADFDKSIINNVKIGLMGPLAGLGDSFFWGTLRIIASGIGISLAQQGSILGMILFLLLFNIPHFLMQYYGTSMGYRFGTSMMSSAKDSGVLQMVSKGATIVGLMVIGAMSASMVIMTTPYAIEIGKTKFEIQTYLDQIFPLLLPLLYTLVMFGLLKKGFRPTTILLITIAVGIIGTFFGIL